jgi:hypothetical protein
MNGGYWQEFGVKKQARVACHPSYRRAPLRMLERGSFAHCRRGVRARSERPLSPTRLRRPLPFAQPQHRGGRHAPDSAVTSLGNRLTMVVIFATRDNWLAMRPSVTLLPRGVGVVFGCLATKALARVPGAAASQPRPSRLVVLTPEAERRTPLAPSGRKRVSGSGCDALSLSTGRSIRAWRTLCGRQSAHAIRLTRYCIASMRADHKRRRVMRKAPPRGLKRPRLAESGPATSEGGLSRLRDRATAILTASATTKAYCRPAPPILLDGAKLLFFWAIRCRSVQTI